QLLHDMLSAMRRTLVAFVIVLATATEVSAQICTGSPAGNGMRALELKYAESDGSHRFGPGLQVNSTGPLAFTTGYSYSTLRREDGHAHSLGVGGYYEYPAGAISLCPGVSGRFSIADLLGVESFTLGAT